MKRHRPHQRPTLGRRRPGCDRCGCSHERLTSHHAPRLGGDVSLCGVCSTWASRRGWLSSPLAVVSPAARSDAVSPEPRPEVMPDA